LPEALLEVQPVEHSGARYHDQLNQLKKHLIADAVKQTKATIRGGQVAGRPPELSSSLIRNLNIKADLKRENEE